LLLLYLQLFSLIREKKNRLEEEDDAVNLDPKPSNDSPLSSITHLNGVEIKQQLGAGNFGAVFYATWNDTPIAAKKLKNQDEFEDFIKETQMLFKLKHPNLIQFLGIFIDSNGDKYIITDYMNQGSLLDVLKKEKNLPLQKLLQMSIDAAKVLLYLEKEKIIHRDVAARNFLMSKAGDDGDYVIKLGDFGMSRNTPDEVYRKKEGSFPIRWCAPEVLNYGTYSSKSDVWAFGVFLWELFSGGIIPYGWLSNQEVYHEVPKGLRLPKPEKCPTEVWEIILSCFTEDPAERPSFSNIIKRLKTFYSESEEPSKGTTKIDPQDYQTQDSSYLKTNPTIDGDLKQYSYAPVISSREIKKSDE